ncbi:hypothetical protein H5410_018143 [Solanum commersonii]|uniref:Uncharacterized protein n=1 Tax=Solanum commersonii TaxID=4109 RepID=A0A9J6A2H2_SOLCO|nr:hypothetical protein H5410_018143 [Solanum commersonii]
MIHNPLVVDGLWLTPQTLSFWYASMGVGVSFTDDRTLVKDDIFIGGGEMNKLWSEEKTGSMLSKLAQHNAFVAWPK